MGFLRLECCDFGILVSNPSIFDWSSHEGLSVLPKGRLERLVRPPSTEFAALQHSRISRGREAHGETGQAETDQQGSSHHDSRQSLAMA
jgi:hypothetical protein